MNPAASPVRAFHVWFSTKGRQPVLVEEIREAVLSLIPENAAKAGASVLALEAIEDHVHLLVELGDGRALADVMHQVKGASAREMFRRYPELAIDMGAGSFWQKSYGARPISAGQIESVKRSIVTQDARPLRSE
jgi:putative transposase